MYIEHLKRQKIPESTLERKLLNHIDYCTLNLGESFVELYRKYLV